MTIFAGDKERNLANTVMDWLLNLGYLGLFLGTFLAGTVLPLSSDILLVGMLAAKADPLMRLVYLRHRRYRAYYAPRSTPFRVNTQDYRAFP